jgi:DNA-directed RNA polymerase specialized sigma24 family protein
MAYKEIAETLQATEAQVKTWLHRARARLLNLMADDDRPPDGKKSPTRTATGGEEV